MRFLWYLRVVLASRKKQNKTKKQKQKQNNNKKTLTLFELSYDRMFYRRLNFSKRKNYYDSKVARSKQLRYYFSLSQIRRTIYKHHVYEEFTEEYKIENNSTNNKKKLRWLKIKTPPYTSR